MITIDKVKDLESRIEELEAQLEKCYIVIRYHQYALEDLVRDSRTSRTFGLDVFDSWRVLNNA